VNLTDNEARAALAPDDPRVVRAVEEYVSALEADAAPDREAFLARHADIRPALAGCLDGLQLIRAARPQLDAIPAVDDPVAAPLGDFRILREVGRGGMGVVYEAEQMSLGRRVALKVLPFAATLDPKHIQRFKNEAHAAGQLHHTNIVAVHFVGCERGVHFYAMQYIDGQSLAQVIADCRLQVAECQAGQTPAEISSQSAFCNLQSRLRRSLCRPSAPPSLPSSSVR
jgi:hypothetical protein